MSDIEVRRVTTKRGETSPDKGEHSVDVVTHDVGVNIDGTFVRFATISEEQLHSAQQRAEAGYYGDSDEQQAGSTAPVGGSESGAAAPDESTPASTASASKTRR